MNWKLTFILGFLILSTFEGVAQMRENLREEIDKIILHETKINRDNTPGMVIGVIFRDSSFVFSYGSVTKDSTVVPDEHTLFEIGGLTKVFTAALIQVLVKDQLLSFDSTLNTYLPDTIQNPNFQGTIKDLLMHTSGLPKFPLEFGIYEKTPDNPYANYEKAYLASFYQQYEPTGAAGAYQYSNLGYALLELAIENVTGQPFSSLVQQKLLRPLQLEETLFQLRPEAQARLAQGYNIGGLPVDPWQFASFEASEGLKSSAADLLRLLQANMHIYQTALDPFWDQQWASQRPTDLNRDTYIGLGWHVIRQKKFADIILHPGSTSGHRVYTGFVPETKTGVVVLTNSEFGIGGLGYLILRMINFNWKKKRR